MIGIKSFSFILFNGTIQHNCVSIKVQAFFHTMQLVNDEQLFEFKHSIKQLTTI